MKTYMALDGLRWSRDSGSANCDMPRSAVFGRSGGGDGHYYYFRMENVKVENGELLLIADTANSNRPFYYSGGIQSKSNDYSFGYYDLKAILPAYEKNGKQCGKGFWPCFWTYYQERDGNCIVEHYEIDILEPCGHQFEDASTNVVG